MSPAPAFLAAGLAAFLAGTAAAQPEKPQAELDELLKQARREITEFEKGGGRRDDARHPVAGWVAKLWALRDSQPSTETAGKAAAEAIHLLLHADRIPEAEARADGLPTDDPAWEFLPGHVSEAAAIKKDYGFLIRKLGAVLAERREPNVRGALLYHLGRGHAKSGSAEVARAAYKEVIQVAAGLLVAKDAENALYELENLSYGQTAPAVAGLARDGSRVALADFRGRVLLLVFWAST